MPTTLGFLSRRGIQVVLTSPDTFTPANTPDVDLWVPGVGSVDFEMDIDDLGMYPSSLNLGFLDKNYPGFHGDMLAHDVFASLIVGGVTKYKGLIDIPGISGDSKFRALSVQAIDSLQLLKSTPMIKDDGSPSDEIRAMFPEWNNGTSYILFLDLLTRLFKFAYPDLDYTVMLHDWTFRASDSPAGFDNLYVMPYEVFNNVVPLFRFAAVADFLHAIAFTFCATFGAYEYGRPYFKKLWPGNEPVHYAADIERISIKRYSTLRRYSLVIFDGTENYLGERAATQEDTYTITNFLGAPLRLYIGLGGGLFDLVYTVLDPAFGETGIGAQVLNHVYYWRSKYRPQYQFEISGTDYLPTDRFFLPSEAWAGNLIPIRLSVDYVNRKTTGIFQAINADASE